MPSVHFSNAQSFHLDPIPCGTAVTLPGLFHQRIDRTPDRVAYRQYDPARKRWLSYSWREIGDMAGRWQRALADEHLAPGDRVAVLLPNCVEWVCFDQAALSLGLVVVPLYPADSPKNIAYVLSNSGSRLLLLYSLPQWELLLPHRAQFPELCCVICRCKEEQQRPVGNGEVTLRYVDEWLGPPGGMFETRVSDGRQLATIVYTSGTTGPPRGVMLTHHNILWDADALLQAIPGYQEDVYLSFLPLSHALERTVGYYVPIMAGSTVAFARSIQDLAEDLQTIRPTMLVAVPRIFERAYAKIQQQLQEKGFFARYLFNLAVDLGWRRFEASQKRARELTPFQRMVWRVLEHLVARPLLSRFGGRLRIAVSGGAPLQETVARCLIGLGLPLLQGYGLTEASPVVSGNRLDNNLPSSVGEPLPGVEVRLGPEAEVLVRAPSLMQGYWNRPEESEQAIDKEGWLHTGDQGRMVDGRLHLHGRLKEILVMSSGEKVAPGDMETAILQLPFVHMGMVVGEGRPYLAALLVMEREGWRKLASALGLDPEDPQSLLAPAAEAAVLKQMQQVLSAFPGQARVRAVALMLEPWSISNGLLTPTLKLKRGEIENYHASQIARLYAGHEVFPR
jgi:long-chain acyl-CoA synthetase